MLENEARVLETTADSVGEFGNWAGTPRRGACGTGGSESSLAVRALAPAEVRGWGPESLGGTLRPPSRTAFTSVLRGTERATPNNSFCGCPQKGGPEGLGGTLRPPRRTA
jgi:hypothetical protein